MGYMNVSMLLAVGSFFILFFRVALVASAFGMQIVWKYSHSRSTLMAERSRRPMYLDMFGVPVDVRLQARNTLKLNESTNHSSAMREYYYSTLLFFFLLLLLNEQHFYFREVNIRARVVLFIVLHNIISSDAICVYSTRLLLPFHIQRDVGSYMGENTSGYVCNKYA